MKKIVKRVAVIGPECTGKSELSAFLASHFNTEWVPEYARGFLDNLTRPYRQEDLITIAHGQIRLEEEYQRDANQVLICDTNLYVIKVWSNFVFGTCEEKILTTIEQRHYDLYLLTNVDIPWEDDPLREHPQKRTELYSIYLSEMKNQAVPFVEISGSRDQRRALAIDAINKILADSPQ